jgi:hypothetical protein
VFTDRAVIKVAAPVLIQLIGLAFRTTRRSHDLKVAPTTGKPGFGTGPWCGELSGEQGHS